MLRYIGIYPMRLISKQQTEAIVEFLQPKLNGFDLIRIGKSGDGGYLVPDDLQGIDMCISPGVENTMHFENDLYERYGIASIMYDASIDKPSELNENFIFHKKFVGAGSSSGYVNFSDIIHSDLEIYKGDFVGQVDIESAEYMFLTSASEDDLKRLRILTIEFHEIERWIEKRYFNEIVSPLLEKLNKVFDNIHVHPNNSGRYFHYKGYKIPNILEITFHRKNRSLGLFGLRDTPHPLDSKNNVHRKELFIPKLKV
jgi:hypothetical protein